MPDCEFFAKFGLFVRRDFLDPALCVQLQHEINASPDVEATSINGDKVVYGEGRSTRLARVPSATASIVEKRLRAVQLAVATHFNVTLADVEGPQFLRYRKGDYFGAHIDGRPSDDVHDPSFRFLSKRQVSCVIFLNGSSKPQEESSYRGGELTFYGLFKDPRAEKLGLPLIGDQGLLIAFKSDCLHEVKAVSQGERYTVVSWYT